MQLGVSQLEMLRLEAVPLDPSPTGRREASPWGRLGKKEQTRRRRRRKEQKEEQKEEEKEEEKEDEEEEEEEGREKRREKEGKWKEKKRQPAAHR